MADSPDYSSGPLPPGPPTAYPVSGKPCGNKVPANPWAPNNPWASPWPAQLQPSVDFVTLKLDGLEIGLYRFQGGTLPHEVHIVVPRAEIERRGRATDGTEEIRRTVLSSITIAHAPRYPYAGSETPEGARPPVGVPGGPGGPGEPRAPGLPGSPEQPVAEPLPPGSEPAQPAEPTEPAQPALPRAPQRPFFGQPAPPGQAPSPVLPRPIGPPGFSRKKPLPPESGHQ